MADGIGELNSFDDLILPHLNKFFFEALIVKVKSSGEKDWLPWLKEPLSVLMLYTPVFIFTYGSSALLGCPRCSL